jgi:hypothetical protein
MARRPISPYLEAPMEPADAAALAAVNQGVASGDQQRRAMRWILHNACRIGGHVFVPGDPHATALLVGRREAGVIIANAMRTGPEAVVKLNEIRRREGEQG